MNRSSLAKAKSLAQADHFDDAIELCDKLLVEGGEEPNEIRRTRAYILSLAGDYARASMDREVVLRSDSASLRDFYQAADAALKARDLDLAAKRFIQTVERGEMEGDRWFHSSAMFYLAFLEMERDNFDAALRYIGQVKVLDEGCQLPIPGVGVVTVADLEKEILRRHH